MDSSRRHLADQMLALAEREYAMSADYEDDQLGAITSNILAVLRGMLRRSDKDALLHVFGLCAHRQHQDHHGQ